MNDYEEYVDKVLGGIRAVVLRELEHAERMNVEITFEYNGAKVYYETEKTDIVFKEKMGRQ